MASNRSKSRENSTKIAVCGMMVALSVAFMLMGGIIPIATYCVPMFSSILLLPILIEYGKKTAWTAFAAVSFITLILGIDKEAAFFYLFLGYYPILKWELEKVKTKILRFLIKLLVFNGAFTLMYIFLGILLNMDAVIQEFMQMDVFLWIAFILLLNVCMYLYDRLLLPLVYLYAGKLRPKLRFLR